MRDLMLKLLSYEPFEVISDKEKEFIDLVLAGNTQFPNCASEYVDLFLGFYNYIKQKNWSNTFWLMLWKNRYYPSSIQGRVDYPILLRKICFYCITEGNLKDDAFLNSFGMRTNILNKWKLCPRYRKLINRESYHSIPLQRNGKKLEYITKVIKSAYYEASRQTAEVRYFDAGDDSWIAPKKNRLLPFIDVFASSGTVAASVEAPEKVVNDVYVPVTCLLFSITNNMDGFRERLAELHNNFVTVDMSDGQNLYSISDWQKHKNYYSAYAGNIEFDNLMILLRNNYLYLHDDFESKVNYLSCQNVDFNNSAYYDMYYDMGAVWFFLNTVTANGYHGKQFYVTDMDITNYCNYLFDVLGVKKTGEKEDWIYLCKFGKSAKKLTMSDIRVKKIKEFAKALCDVIINTDDFITVIRNYSSDGFIYLDSPYFLTTDYDIPFQDEQHKLMLDELRDADFDWLFSMQYKPFGTSKPAKDVKKRANSGNVLIKNYREYYCGFVNAFKIETDKKGNEYYVTAGDIDKEKAEKLYVILFEPLKTPNENLFKNEDGEFDEELKDAYYEKNGYKIDTKEMMICNFDVRRVIPYGASCVVIPFMKFLEFAFYENGVERDYQYIRAKAREYRALEIQKNYYTGAWV